MVRDVPGIVPVAQVLVEGALELVPQVVPLVVVHTVKEVVQTHHVPEDVETLVP